ncbi:MAG: ParA family protein [Silvanigrellaceae bacterium]
MADARIIALSNQKGGVGKTTSAVNIAASLAAAEYRVLLVDFDPQGNASSALGVEARNMKPSSYEMLIQEAEPSDCIVKTELSCLDLIPANQELIGAEIELVSALGREHRLKDALSLVKHNYDFILIDCPPALGLLTVNALVAAHGILVPLQCEYFALEGLSQLMKTVELVKKFLNTNLELEGILLTMFDRRNNLSHQVEVDVREHFKELVLSTKIPRNVKLGEAPSHGKPIILYDISSPGALAYMEAAQELLARTQLKRTKPASNRSANTKNQQIEHP